ncbi:hypothetical protein V6N11_065907 [Hibiscus sabdariffa]|uniref:Uncharacterized protein n=1 Tax=Hibiscus sabdariffa TaxID=183260 RepID=A0ABR2PIN9_9ROSI
MGESGESSSGVLRRKVKREKLRKFRKSQQMQMQMQMGGIIEEYGEIDGDHSINQWTPFDSVVTFLKLYWCFDQHGRHSPF